MKKKKFKRALFIGRFQPFHDGHLNVIEDIAKESGRLTIIIAGPARPDARNPFSFAERKRMAELALAGGKIRNYEIHETRDVNDDGKWGEHVKRLGPFDIAYSRNPWTVRCLKNAGITVAKHKFYGRYKNCGSEIRKRIMHGKRWKNLVPYRVYDYISEIEGEKRIRGL
jgi:nicotinamide-nucleotide adenylyltransferase